MRTALKPFGLMLALLWISGSVRADVESGPRAGEKLAPLKVHAVTGDVTGEVVDYTARREGKPTVYFFVPAKKINRQSVQLLRGLDSQLAGQVNGAAIVAVWLTEDVEDAKNFLPRIQAAIQPGNTALTVYDGDQFGPGEWGINIDAEVTIVLAHQGQVIAARGYVSPNDTLVRPILKELSEGVKQ